MVLPAATCPGATGAARQTLNALIYPIARLSVPSSASLTVGATRFSSFQASLPINFPARSQAAGDGASTLQVTSDFLTAGGPSAAVGGAGAITARVATASGSPGILSPARQLEGPWRHAAESPETAVSSRAPMSLNPRRGRRAHGRLAVYARYRPSAGSVRSGKVSSPTRRASAGRDDCCAGRRGGQNSLNSSSSGKASLLVPRGAKAGAPWSARFVCRETALCGAAGLEADSLP